MTMTYLVIDNKNGHDTFIEEFKYYPDACVNAMNTFKAMSYRQKIEFMTNKACFLYVCESADYDEETGDILEIMYDAKEEFGGEWEINRSYYQIVNGYSGAILASCLHYHVFEAICDELTKKGWRIDYDTHEYLTICYP